MPVANLTKLGRGAVIPLDRRIGEPVDVMVNGRIVARGEVVVVDETTSRFGISLTEVVGTSGRDKELLRGTHAMSEAAQAKPGAPHKLSLTGAEKVAVLLLAIGKPRAAKAVEAVRSRGAQGPDGPRRRPAAYRRHGPGGAGRRVRAEVLQRHQLRRHREGGEAHAVGRDGRGPVRRRDDRRVGAARRGPTAGVGGDHQDQGRRAACLP